MKKSKISGKIRKAALIGFVIVTVITVLYIMANGLGLIPELDFGAGAYYYADIPEFAKYVNGTHYTSGLPMWVYIVLFLIWGSIMYKAWEWLDKKFENK